MELEMDRQIGAASAVMWALYETVVLKREQLSIYCQSMFTIRYITLCYGML